MKWGSYAFAELNKPTGKTTSLVCQFPFLQESHYWMRQFRSISELWDGALFTPPQHMSGRI